MQIFVNISNGIPNSRFYNKNTKIKLKKRNLNLPTQTHKKDLINKRASLHYLMPILFYSSYHNKPTLDDKIHNRLIVPNQYGIAIQSEHAVATYAGNRIQPFFEILRVACFLTRLLCALPPPFSSGHNTLPPPLHPSYNRVLKYIIFTRKITKDCLLLSLTIFA